MKKLIFVLILPLTLIFAQTNDEEKPIDLTGKFALMFQIDQNFDLNSFKGMSFAGKYFFSDDWGVRLVLGIDYTNSDENSSNNQLDPEFYQYKIADRDIVSYKLVPSVIYKVKNSNNIKVFFGAGPFVAYSNYEYAEEFDRTNSEIYHVRDGYKDYAIGFTFFANVEWFVADNISLSAEYGFQYSYVEIERYHKYFETNELAEESSSKDYKKSFQDLPVSLGVSIYF